MFFFKTELHVAAYLRDAENMSPNERQSSLASMMRMHELIGCSRLSVHGIHLGFVWRRSQVGLNRRLGKRMDKPDWNRE